MESPAGKCLAPAARGLLSQRISDLKLSIKGTRLGELVGQLYRELEAARLPHFKPETYLSDEWGCPCELPVIGIPFYLAAPELCDLECRMSGVEAETDDEVMMYLRHESGHAFSYAFKLFRLAGWRKVFGDYSLPYREAYGVVPFSPAFVRHIPGWYAQKHPDDDFAESFAVWLTPGSNWREVYAGTPALKKLNYIDNAARVYGVKPFQARRLALDAPVETLTMTLDSWYRTYACHRHRPVKIHPILDADLRRAFPDASGDDAADIIEAGRVPLVFEVNRWTGLERHILTNLVDDLLSRIKALGLKIAPGDAAARLRTFTIIVATLAMNYVGRGKFVG